MGGTRTSDEIKEDLIADLGSDLGGLFFSLYNEITWLTIKWNEFKELFADKESRVEIMNESAPFFFMTIQKVLSENIMLGIARLTDPPKTGRRKNITLKAFLDFIQEESTRKQFQIHLDQVDLDASFARDWRNRWIAHMDHELATDPKIKPLEPASKEKLRIAIESIHEIYNKAEEAFLNTTTSFKFLSTHKGALSLLIRVEDGLLLEKEHYARELKGDLSHRGFKRRV